MADKHPNLLRIDPYTDTLANSASTIYYGYAAAGTLDTDSTWSLRKVAIVSNVRQEQFPIISGKTYLGYGLSWSGRTTYTYR